jgi:hypothetical protein
VFGRRGRVLEGDLEAAVSVQSSDEMFRPVALRLGPDGCLYLVDWYNKIISHNEVPRNHPDRDKKRGRIWRVKHKDAKPLEVPDFMKLSGDELLARLGGENTPQSHLAWQAITDREMKELAPKLKSIVSDKSLKAGKRIGALWALEGLDEKDRFGKGAEYFEFLKPLLGETNRNIRREVIRALGTRFPSIAGERNWSAVRRVAPTADDADPRCARKSQSWPRRRRSCRGRPTENSWNAPPAPPILPTRAPVTLARR